MIRDVRNCLRWVACLTVILGLSTPRLFAQSSVTLAWNANSGTTTTGYRLHYGTISQNYSNIVAAGASTSVTLTNLTPGTTYYFAVGAYGSLGIEGPYSTEVSYTVPVARPIPPAITLTSPANGANFTAPANITLAPSVTANGHAIASVQFYNGATLLGQDAVSPYSMVWSNVAGGSYSLTARVVYDGTSTVDSGPANITVAGTNGAVVLKHKINSSKHSVLSGTGQASRTFDVQASSNLKTWTTIGSGTTASDGSFQWTDPTVATNKVRMYRFVAH